MAITAFLMVSAAQAADCKLTQIASLPITFDSAGGPTVPVTLGSRHSQMLVDTGGVRSFIGQHVVDEIKPDVETLKRSSFTLVNGRELKEIARVRPFALGEMTDPEFAFLIIPDGMVGPKSLEGTIAPDILANFDVDFDFGAGKMNLFSQDHCPGKVVYWAKDWSEIPFRSDIYHITLDMTLDEKPFVAELDTGSSSSFLSASIAKRMFGIEPSGTDESERGFHHTFNALKAAGFAIKNPEFSILPDDRLKEMNHYGEMLLGMNELKRFHIYVAYKEEVLYVTAAGAH